MTTTQTRTAATSQQDALAALPLPPLGALSDTRARGAECVWGGEPLTAETAVDLGERISPTSGTTLFLRSCRPCTLPRLLQAVREHPGSCEQCVDDPTLCEIRRALRALALELRR